MTRRAIRWLSLAADDPADCRSVWRNDPRMPYLLPTGRSFDVLTADHRLGMETFDQLRLHDMPVGPVVADRKARRIGFFLPVDSRERFARVVAQNADVPPEYRFLGNGSYVVVPGPLALTGDRYEWLNAPFRPQHGSPLQLVSLGVMFCAASVIVALADNYGQETAGA